MASDLDLDDNTPPPTRVKKRKLIAGVVIPYKRIDRNLYRVFMSNMARQTMVRSKRDGRLKGIKFEWLTDYQGLRGEGNLGASAAGVHGF